MPVYEYYCPKCQTKTERFVNLQDFDILAYSQICDKCESLMKKLISIPCIRTDNNFISGSDDGFLNDNIGRQMALQKARVAGVNVAGKKFHPGLCRKGVPFDPFAWYGSKGEVKRKAESLGRNVDGCVTHRTSVRDEHYAQAEKPYRVSRELVKEDVDRANKERFGGTATPAQVERLYEEKVEKHSGLLGK